MNTEKIEMRREDGKFAGVGLFGRIPAKGEHVQGKNGDMLEIKRVNWKQEASENTNYFYNEGVRPDVWLTVGEQQS